MSTQPQANGYKVYRTENRQDDEGEFIIRFPPNAGPPANCQYVVVRTQEKILKFDDDTPVEPTVIAAVRPLSRDDSFGREKAIPYCQLDMGLRVAVGVKGHNPHSEAALSDVTGKAETVYWKPFLRNIRPSVLATWVGHQWVLCRVQRSLTGDFETPICRVGAPYLASLGIPIGGVIVIESPKRSATRRLLAADPEQETQPLPDFEQLLGVERLKLPCIYMDMATRKLLEVAPGQAVWVRRDHWAVFRGKLLQVASALGLAVVGIVFSIRELVGAFWGDLVLMLTALAIVAIIGWCAVLECQDHVRAD